MTLCVGAVATHAVNPNLFKKLPYDPIKDFEPVTLIAHVPNVLVVTPEFQQRTGIKSVKDLIAYCKANPDKLNYASGGNGSAGHMAGELLKAKAGIKMVHVPYAGASAAQLSVLAGQTDLIFDNLVGLRQHSGRQTGSACRHHHQTRRSTSQCAHHGRSRCDRV
jgi:tripartite-type tricarboxylate transporter receptor subunit TctC